MKHWHRALSIVAIAVCMAIATSQTQAHDKTGVKSPHVDPPKADQASTAQTSAVDDLPSPYEVLLIALENGVQNFTATPKDPDGWTVKFSKLPEGSTEKADYKAVMERGGTSAYYLIRNVSREEGNSVVFALEVVVPADQPYFAKK